MIKKIFNHKTETSTWAAIIVASSSFLSRLLGLFRDRLLAGAFGAGQTLDVYFAAFRLPTLVQAVFVAGGVGATFLPLFSKEMRKSEKKAFLFVNNLLHFTLLFLGFLSLLFLLFAPSLTRLVAPGLGPGGRGKLVLLTRILMITPVLFGLSSIFSGLLHYFDRFFCYSLAPLFYNFGIIAGIVFLYPLFGVAGLGWGAVLGALGHLLVQVPSALDTGFFYRALLSLKNYRLKKVLSLSGPTVLGSFFVEMNLTVLTALASRLASGSIAIFNLVQNLGGAPVGLIGIPFSIAFFPALSKKWAGEDREVFWRELWSYFRQIVFLSLPAAVLAFVLRAQVVRIVLKTGAWGWQETRLSAAGLGLFSFSIVFLCLLVFLRKVFYTIQRTGVLAISEGLKFGLSILSSYLLILAVKRKRGFFSLLVSVLELEGVEGVEVLAFPLGLTAGAFFQFLFLTFFLRKKSPPFGGGFSLFPFLRAGFMSLLAGCFTWLSLRPLSSLLSGQGLAPLVLKTGLSGLGGLGFYLGVSFLLGFPEAKRLKKEVFS